MLNIVAIGGGEFKSRGTLPIDQAIVAMAGKERPRVLFIPTASQESGGYITTFRHIYGQQLGCRTQPLMLGKGEPKSRQQVLDKVMASDIIYVGSGNSRYMLDEWRRFGVDDALRQAAYAGKILCGLSAGAICWFEASWSDYPLLEGTGRYRLLPALGLLPGLVCPHSDEPGRMEGLEQAVQACAKPCLCLPNGAALCIQCGQFRVFRLQGAAAPQKMEPDGRLWTIPESGGLGQLGMEAGL